MEEKIFNSKKQKKIRKNLRSNSTEAEILLWNEIKNKKLGYKFRRQHGIKSFIVDFYCPEAMLVIEIDGQVHDFSQQKAKDCDRDKSLSSIGLNVIRYSNYDICFNLEKVIEEIKDNCEKIIALHPSPHFKK